MLRPLGIYTHSIWPLGPRKPGNSSAKGYYRSDFEAAWAAYCDQDGTSAQFAPIRQLGGGSGG